MPWTCDDQLAGLGRVERAHLTAGLATPGGNNEEEFSYYYHHYHRHRRPHSWSEESLPNFPNS